jgi:hypothetical protein
MSGENTKVYFVLGGDELVIGPGGKLTLAAGATAASMAAIKIGTWISNTASVGFVLTATDNAAIAAYCDDGGAAITSSITTPIFARYLVTVDQTSGATQTALHAQLKVAGLGAGGGTRAFSAGGLRGAYIFNQLGTVTLSGNAELVGLNQATTLAGVMTVGATNIWAGVDINLAGAGTASVTAGGIAAGLVVRAKSTEAARWPWAMYVPAGSCQQGIYAVIEPTGSTHKRAFDLNITDATTSSSGYNASFFCEVTNTGAKSATEYSAARFNLIFDTATQTGTIYNALKAKVGYQNTPTLTAADVNGFFVSVDEIGTCGRLNAVWLEMYNTSNATTSSFIEMHSQGSAQVANMFKHLGTNRPTNFYTDQLDGGGGFWDTGVGATSACIGHLKVLFGSTPGYLRVYASTS